MRSQEKPCSSRAQCAARRPDRKRRATVQLDDGAAQAEIAGGHFLGKTGIGGTQLAWGDQQVFAVGIAVLPAQQSGTADAGNRVTPRTPGRQHREPKPFTDTQPEGSAVARGVRLPCEIGH